MPSTQISINQPTQANPVFLLCLVIISASSSFLINSFVDSYSYFLLFLDPCFYLFTDFIEQADSLMFSLFDFNDSTCFSFEKVSSTTVFLFLNISVSVRVWDILLLFESLSHRVPGFLLLILMVPHNSSLSLSSLSPSAAVEVDLMQ